MICPIGFIRAISRNTNWYSGSFVRQTKKRWSELNAIAMNLLDLVSEYLKDFSFSPLARYYEIL